MKHYLRNLRGRIYRLKETFVYKLLVHKCKTLDLSKEYLNQEKREEHIIVSLTSYPARLENLDMVIRSILNQTVKPDKILLYLGTDSDNAVLSDKLLCLKKAGLTIIKGVEDIKPHKKYFYAMQDYPDSIIITVDDDAIYEPKLIERLMQSYYKNPKCVHAKRVHEILFDNTGKVRSYNDWIYEQTMIKNPSMKLLATGVGGVLYPPKLFTNEAFNLHKIKELSLMADDIWLKYMETMSGIPVVFVPGDRCLPFLIENSQSTGLFHTNVESNQNDICIHNLENVYGNVIFESVKENKRHNC